MRFPDIVTPYPLVFFVFCLLAGVAVAMLLYFRDKRHELPTVIRWVAAILRTLAFSMLAFLLMQPLVQSMLKEKEKPVIAVLLDNSQSLRMGNSADVSWASSLRSAMKSLGSAYDVKYFSFSDDVSETDSLDFTGYRTDIGRALNHADAMLRNRNLGAIVLASDGIYNTGTDPLSVAEGIRSPVYTVALGDSNQYADAKVAKVEANRIAFLGNNFPVRIHTRTIAAAGSSLRLEVRRDGMLLFSKMINVSGRDHYSLEHIELSADKPGLNKYVVSLSPLSNEINLANNRQSVYVEVLDSRKKVLILAASPHPDITALKQAFESKQQILVDVKYLPAAALNVKEYDMAVLYQLPNQKQDARQIISEIRQASIPAMFCLGAQTDVRAFDNLSLGIKIAGPAGKYNEVGAYPNSRFPLFRPEERTLTLLVNMDPLTVPFGEFNSAPDLQTLLMQRIGRVNSEKPLLAFHDQLGWRAAFLTGEGIWRWRLEMFRETGSHEWFSDFIAMSVQYLAVSEKKGRFRVEWPTVLLQSDPVEVRAELYNASYQPETGKEINLEVRDSAGNRYNYIFAEDGEAYALNLGYLKAGQYSYRASVKDVPGISTLAGSFEVEEVNVESMVLQANHRMLSGIAALRGAEMLHPDGLDRLADLIRAREDIKPIIFTHWRYTDLSRWPYYLVVILMLLTAEWLIRRLSGTY